MTFVVCYGAQGRRVESIKNAGGTKAEQKYFTDTKSV